MWRVKVRAIAFGVFMTSIAAVSANQVSGADDRASFSAADQHLKLEAVNKTKMTAVKAMRDQENGAIEQLRQKVEANGSDADISPAFATVQSEIKSIQNTEDAFWDSVAQFMPPSQVAKLFLKSHPPMTLATADGSSHKTPPAAQSKPPSPSATPASDWKSYFGATKEQQQKLDVANKAKGENVKSLHQQRNDQLEQLNQQVEAKGPEAGIQTLLASVRTTERALQAAENGYWDTVAGFLTPTEVAKLFLRGHPKK